MGKTGAAAAIQRRWVRFIRWAPYVLLGLSTALTVATAGALMTGTEQLVAWLFIVAALAVELWWGRAGRGLPEHAALGRVYYAVRAAVAFVLTWLNPFFAVYATLGYIDATQLLPKRWIPPGLLVTAVTLAGSQSGGLPPASGWQWGIFAVLFGIHAGIVLTLTHLSGQEADLAKINEATIAELERTNARLEQALAENAGLHQQLLLQAREAGIADERRRLAAEIHDTLAQGLAGIITQLQAAADLADHADPAAARRHVDRAAALARQSLGEARRSVHDLGPAALENAALAEALKQTTAQWSAQTGVPASFTVTGTAEPLHDEIEATILRIAQEALANAAKHAGATRVGVTLSFIDDEVTLDVRDDGRGFDPERLPDRAGAGGFGLRGMRARAVRLAGTVDIESEPGCGTAVSARVPLVRHA